MSKIILYVGCGLTLAPKPFQKDVEDLKIVLQDHFDVLEFIGTGGGDSPEECRQVFAHDIHNCVEKCGAMLAICDHPSTGLGWEMSVAHQRGVPLLGVAHRDSKVTRLVRGVPGRNFSFRRYDVLAQVPGFLREHLAECLVVQA